MQERNGVHGEHIIFIKQLNVSGIKRMKNDAIIQCRMRVLQMQENNLIQSLLAVHMKIIGAPLQMHGEKQSH